MTLIDITEIMFKQCKQYLSLRKCQSNDLDTQIADATIDLILYLLLSLIKNYLHLPRLANYLNHAAINL